MIMKNIIKRIVLWLEKGRIYFLTSLFLATLVGIVTHNVASGLVVLLLLLGGALLYVTFLYFGLDKYGDGENASDAVKCGSGFLAVLLSLIVPLVLYFFLGGEMLNFSLDLMLKSMAYFFACSFAFLGVTLVWRCLLNWAKK